MKRKSGILMHISSLPGEYGIGEIGAQARDFIDTLRLMGQSQWQILPLGPTGYGNSPYQSFSSFAGNELLIGFDDLIADGLLTPSAASSAYRSNTGFVDFETVIKQRKKVLNQVARQFPELAPGNLKEQFAQFCIRQAHWLDEYSLFTLLKDINDQKPWHLWSAEIRDRQALAMAEIEHDFQAQLTEIKILQFLFYLQWQRLSTSAKNNGIELIGDLPVFIAHDSADAWCHRELLQLDNQGQCKVVAGVPPDDFSETGQRWGNPLYDWPIHQQDNFSWWFKRLDHIQGLVNTVRIDHFRGFQAYWEIPITEKTAINGQWINAPGDELFSRYLAHNPNASFIAEDLGVITAAVEQLRDKFNLPGMRVLQFGFDDDKENIHLPDNYPENCIAYTSTHDNDTLPGWLNSNQQNDLISKMLKIPVDEINT